MKKIHILGLCFLLLSTLLTNIPQTMSAPPSEPELVTYTAYFYSDESSYVYQGLPSINYNTGMDKYNLMIGQDEFTNNYQFYVKFNTIDLPSDAVIKSAKIRIWCSFFDTEENALTEMRKVTTSWNEDTLNWNNKPSVSSTIDQKNVGIDGPYDFNALTLVEDWIDTPSQNYGVLFVNEQYDQLFMYVFYSDNDATHSPRLQITYETSTGEEPDPPEELPEDTTPCEIEYTVSPENPQSGDLVTISVTATDDIAMQYISIWKAAVEVELCEAVGTQTTLNCSYSEVLNTGTYIFNIFADDKGGESRVGEPFTVEVQGTGSDPIVTLDIEFEEDTAIPTKHRLLPMDGQRIDITATATDPDGIDFMTITVDGTPLDFSYDPPQTEVEETITVINGVDVLEDCSVPCTLRYSVRAYDIEDRSTRVEGEDIEIGAPWQWSWGLPFANWGCDENHTWEWSMMESIYGMNEVYWNVRTGWRNPRAERIYENKVQTGGRNGHCYGMCVTAVELARPSARIYANIIQDTATSIDGLEQQNWNYTWRYYYARQAGQYSKDTQSEIKSQFSDQDGLSTTRSSGLHPHMEDILNSIIDDLDDGNPGVIVITDEAGGHAVVPWRVVLSDGITPTRIYIYDPNRPHASTQDSTDYTNTNHYPFIECGVDSTYDGWWSYVWNSTSTWDDNIFYLDYNTVIGDASVINYVGSAGITGQRLPTSLQISAMVSGDTAFYVEDPIGRKTGYVNGELVVNIPYSSPIFEFAGKDDLVDMFVFPSNISLTFHMESTVETEDSEGTYSLMIWDESSFYALENVINAKETIDRIQFSPRTSNAGTPDYTFRFQRGDVTKLRDSDPMDYEITIAKEFYNSPFVGREYTFTSGQHEQGAEVELSISDDYEDLIVETFDVPFSFTVTTKSTESLEDDSEIDFIPESKDDFSMDANEKITITPEDWATTSRSGSFLTDENQDDTGNQNPDDDTTEDEKQTPGFGILFIIFALLFVIAVRKRKF
jgi:hypothetical protein